MSTAVFNIKLCRMGFHTLKGAEYLGSGHIEITSKKNHPPLFIEGPYDMHRCVCGENFTTGLTQKKAVGS